MTPPDKPEDTETESEGSAERTSVIATGEAERVQDTGEPDEAGTRTPPPWQRVNADEAHQDTTQNLSANGDGGWPGVDDATVNVERPVVTGTAAPRLFGGDGVNDAGHDESPPRTSLHLDSGATGLRGSLGVTGAAPSALRRPGRGPRRANLQVKRFDPWSVLKLSLVLGVALFFVWLVAVGALYAVLDGMGVWDKLNGISGELLNADTSGSGEPLISAGRVFGIAAIIGAINIVLFSALATVGSFVYNVSADLAGGLEVTLAERE